MKGLVAGLVVLLATSVGAQPTLQPGPEPSPYPAFDGSMPPASPPLTLVQALQQAYAHNTDIQVARSAVNQAYWRYYTAVSQPSGEVSLGLLGGFGQAIQNHDNSSLTNDEYVQATQTFLAFGVLATSRSRAMQDYQGTVADLGTARITLYQQTKDAFYELLASQELQRVSRQNFELAQQVHKLAQIRFDSGASPRLDVINSDVDLGRARQDLLNARSRLVAAQAGLNLLLGTPPAQPVTVQGAFYSQPFLKSDYPQLLALADRSSPIESARHAVQFSKLDALLTDQGNNPYFNVAVLFDFPTTSYYVNGQFNLPLDWGQTRNAAREKREIALQARYTLQDTALTQAASLQSAYTAYLNAFEGATTYASTVLFPSEEAYNMTRTGYMRGALPFIQVINAEQTLFSARLGYLDVLLKLRNAFHQVELAAGRELETAYTIPDPAIHPADNTPATTAFLSASP